MAAQPGILAPLSDLPAQWDLLSLSARLLLLFSIPVLYYVLSALASAYQLRAFPGPLIARFTHLWFFRKMASGHIHPALIAQYKKYGPLSVAAPGTLLCADPDEVIRINGMRSSWTRGGWYKNLVFDFENHNIITLMDTKAHDARRAKLARAYEGKGLANLDEVVDEQLGILVDMLRERYTGSTKVVDWSKTARYFSFDVAIKLLTGQNWGYIRAEKDLYEFFELGDAMVPVMHSFGVLPPIRWLTSSRWLMQTVGPSARDEGGIGRFMGAVREELRKRVEKPKEAPQKDLMAEWLKGGLSARDAESEAVLGAVAGTDTVATPTRAIVLYLASSPAVYNKLKAEIKAGIKAGKISKPITNAEAQKLPYLQAVIQEGMRIVPTTTTGFPKASPPGGDTICGMFVPEGVEVYPNNSAILTDPKLWGEDVNIFRPERWLECDDKQRVIMARTVDLIFGKGRWSCLGRQLAWIELNKIFVELLRNFDIQVANPGKPWNQYAYSSVLVEDFYIRFTEDKLD
ncbi:hypothetical protein OQA88_10921 [Cercophora sp. LCS_1]